MYARTRSLWRVIKARHTNDGYTALAHPAKVNVSTMTEETRRGGVLAEKLESAKVGPTV